MKDDVIAKAIGIKQCSSLDGKTIFSVEDNVGKRDIVFDDVYVRWMQNLYILIYHIAEERDKRNVSVEMMEKNPPYSFFGLAEGVSDQLMYEFTKDELSECCNNCNLDILAYHVLPQKVYEPSKEVYIGDWAYAQIKRYFQRLICKDFNNFIVAQFYDFYISYWSCFESCISGICKQYSNEIDKSINESQFKKVKKFIKDYLGEEQAELIEKNKMEFQRLFPKYKSFTDNYNFLYKIIKDDYRRDINKDKEILLYCGAFRNTLHNNGVHKKKNMEIEIKNVRFELCQGKPAYLDDHSKLFILAKEVFDIYLAIVDAVEITSSNSC